MKFGTRCVHAGEGKDPHGAHSVPIYQTSSYSFKSAEKAQAIFSGKEQGYVYARSPPNTPTHKAFTEKISALEGAVDAIAFSSGMAAESAVALSILRSGDHLISTDVIYGGTFGLFRSVLSRLAIDVTFVDTSNIEAAKSAFRENTRMVFIESPANPTMGVSDIREICKTAKEAGAVSVVDNTFSSPYFQRPLELGADIVVESCTKYIGGHGDLLGGIAAGSSAAISRLRRSAVALGATMGSHEAWLCLRGLKTLHLRMERHASNAMALAQFLDSHPKVERVMYPGLPEHPQHDVAKRQMSGYSGMVSFELRGGIASVRRLLDSVRLASIAVSLGSVDTLIQHPATMTHAVMPTEYRIERGISDGLVRMSVGIEDEVDIIADIDQALEKV